MVSPGAKRLFTVTPDRVRPLRPTSRSVINVGGATGWVIRQNGPPRQLSLTMRSAG